MWKNMIEPGRPQTTKKCGTEKKRLACGVINAMFQTSTKYLIFIAL
jgi:hypothetical protein